jgi:hypothetical protein
MNENLNKAAKWKSLLDFESAHGSIKIIENSQNEVRKTRLVRNFRIEFITPEETSIDFGTRRGAAHMLKQLLENFGEYTHLKKFDNLEEIYLNNNSISQALTPLKTILMPHGYTIEREAIPYSLRYRICKNTDTSMGEEDLQNSEM